MPRDTTTRPATAADRTQRDGRGRLLATFAALLIGTFVLELARPVQHELVLPWTALLARVCAALVTVFDAQAAAAGKILWNPATGFGVSIEPGCNGIEAFLILACGMLAYPAGWRLRVVGLLVGFLAVQGVNVVRVISLFYLGQWHEGAFRFAHEYLWQALIMVDVLLVWLFWMRAGDRPT